MSSTGELLILGSLVVDKIESLGAPNSWHARAGGNALYTSLGASLVPDCHVVTLAKCGEDYPLYALDALEKRGIETNQLIVKGARSSCCEIRYRANEREISWDKNSPSFVDMGITADDVPVELKVSKEVHVCANDYRHHLKLLPTIRDIFEEARISLDSSYNLPSEDSERYLDCLSQVDLFLPSDSELSVLQGNESVSFKKEEFQKLGVASCIVKRAEHGVDWMDSSLNQPLNFSALVVPNVVDVTGAGDVFCGAFRAAQSAGHNIESAITYGLVAASFAVESDGPNDLLKVTQDDFKKRLNNTQP